MLTRLFRRCAQLGRSLARALRQRLIAATKPAEQAVVAGALTDLVRSRPALVAENAFLGSVRRECLDRLLVLGQAHLRRVLREYVAYFNGARPHQGLRQRVPDAPAGETPRPGRGGHVHAVPILGGLHDAYGRAA